QDTLPSSFTGASYTATATGGATGFTSSGSGNINDTVNMPSGSTITYTVTGTASEEGNLSNTATVTVPSGTTDPNTNNNSATDTDTVSDPAVVATGVAVSAVEASAFSGKTVMTFTDPAGAESGSGHYAVTSINWGDGTSLDTSSGAISGPVSGTFTVTGGHTYAEEGSYTITVKLDHEGVSTTQTTTATVSDPAVVATGVAVSAVEASAFSGKTVMTFTDP